MCLAVSTCRIRCLQQSSSQGLCVSGGWRWSKDESERWGGVLGVVAETRGNLLDARAAQEADGGITQEGHHRRSLPFVEGALVLAEGDILRAMQVVLDAPVVPFEREEACWWSLRLVMP